MSDAFRFYIGGATTEFGCNRCLDDYSSIQNIVFNAATLTQIKKQKFPQWIGTVCYAALLLSMNGGGRVVWDAHTQKNTKDDFKLATRSECHSKKAPQLKTVSVYRRDTISCAKISLVALLSRFLFRGARNDSTNVDKRLCNPCI